MATETEKTKGEKMTLAMSLVCMGIGSVLQVWFLVEAVRMLNENKSLKFELELAENKASQWEQAYKKDC